MGNMDRLLLELNNKQYYTYQELEVYLNENGLDPCETYKKETNHRKLLCTVRDILESLANNIDVFRQVETEFATTGDAYKFLERRLQRLQNRIDSLPVDDNSTSRDNGDFSFIFRG